jgi:hypothetical protein
MTARSEGLPPLEARWQYEARGDLNTPRCPYCAHPPFLLVTWCPHGTPAVLLCCCGEEAEHDDWMVELHEELGRLTAARGSA